MKLNERGKKKKKKKEEIDNGGGMAQQIIQEMEERLCSFQNCHATNETSITFSAFFALGDAPSFFFFGALFTFGRAFSISPRLISSFFSFKKRKGKVKKKKQKKQNEPQEQALSLEQEEQTFFEQTLQKPKQQNKKQRVRLSMTPTDSNIVLLAPIGSEPSEGLQGAESVILCLIVIVFFF